MLTPRKRLGQNFLRDGNIARKIVNSLQATRTDSVVEIGPGTGALTTLLCPRFDRLTAIEIDPRMRVGLKECCPGLNLVEGDVKTFDWKRLAKEHCDRIHIIGNLPYYLTSEILFGILDAVPIISEAVIMVQYEVAKRIVARPSTKAYGILSVATQLVSTPSLLFAVSPNVFFPKPDVRSAVIRLEFPEHDPFSDRHEANWTRSVIRRAFNQRRKTLRNSLQGLTDGLQNPIPDTFAKRRAEELTPQDFLTLARYLQSGS